MNRQSLSPEIIPTKYERSGDEEVGDIVLTKYGNWVLNMPMCEAHPQIDVVDRSLVKFYNEDGSMFFGNGHAHVHDSMFRSYALPVLREMVLNVLSQLQDIECVRGLEPVQQMTMTKDSQE